MEQIISRTWDVRTYVGLCSIGFFERDHIPENVDAREDTNADEILSRCSNDMLNPMFTRTNSKGSRGAPSHPATSQMKVELIQFIKRFGINMIMEERSSN